MNNQPNINCETITKMNQESQNQKLRLFAKVDISTKLKILDLQKQLFHKLKSVHSDVNNTVLTLCSLILAVDTIEKKLDDVNLNAIKLRGKNIKTKVKREKVLGYWAIVRSLKLEQNMSFRDISAYFAKYHKLNVSYSTVYELWKEIEKKMENKNG
jgi:hypothetical protein